MKTLSGIGPNMGIVPAGEGADGKSDPKLVAKEIETVFLNELMKIMLEKTSFGQNKTISTFLPVVTSEIAKSLAGRGTGVGDYLTRGLQTGGIPGYDLIKNKKIDTDGKSLALDAEPTAVLIDPPVEGRVSSGYGLRHDPFGGRLRQHNGIDIAVPEGTPITPTAPGKVIFSGNSGGYGNCVIVDHGDGLTSIYAHNSVNYAKPGDVVDRNSVLALAGSTGKSTGSHVHFEVRRHGSPVDPTGLFG